MGWLDRPIGTSTREISAVYGIASILGNVSAFRIATTYDLSDAALFSMLATLAIALFALGILETIWMVDLEEETG